MDHPLVKRLKQADLQPYMPLPFWSWNDWLEPEKLREQIRTMKQAGMGGFFMHARSGLHTEYLGEDWFAAVEASVDEAKKLGMEAWCYDENGWPSGFAGGKLLADEENWAHYLKFEKKDSFDPKALAVYIIKNDSICRVTESVGNAQYLTVYEGLNSSTVDILNPRITDAFLALTHEKYAKRYGEAFGENIRGFFTDEPQYFRWETAYSPMMLEIYKERHGKDLLDQLGCLFVDCREAKGFRFRYWRLMNELYCENFIKRVQDWCRKHHCRITGHSIEESSLAAQMWCCAGVMPFYEYEDIPGVDSLGRRVGTELAPRQASSVAQQLGKKQVLTETFACAGWDVTPQELKWIAEWQYVNGVNRMCHHLYPYSIRGQRKRDYPAFYSDHNPWTRELVQFDEYFSKLGYLLGESREAADVLLIHPIHSAYLTYDRVVDAPSVEAVSTAFMTLIEEMGAAGLVHHYGDERLMEKYGKVENGKLIVGQCAYSHVVVPSCENLDSSTVTLLQAYLAQGGKLIFAGEKPSRIDGELADLSRLRATMTMEELMAQKALFAQKDTAVRGTLRYRADGGFFYGVNLSKDSSQQVTVSLPFAGVKKLDLQTGEVSPVAYEKNPEGILVSLDLEAFESLILMEDGAAESVAAVPALGETVDLLSVMELTQPVDNALTLDFAALSYDGQTWTAPMPIMSVAEKLLMTQENRRIWLRYTFRTEVLPRELYLEYEPQKNPEVLVNGKAVSLEQAGRLDQHFRCGDIAPYVKEGENEIVVSLDYYQSEHTYYVFRGFFHGNGEVTEALFNCIAYETGIESVYLFGRFSVRTENGYWDGAGPTSITDGSFVIGQPVDRVTPKNISVQGYPFFSGAMKLRTTVTLDDTNWTLRVKGRVQYVKVWVNGAYAGIVLLDNKLNLEKFLRPGENVLELELMSSNRNLFGPHHFKDAPEPVFVTPMTMDQFGTWVEDQSPEFTTDYAFVPFGAEILRLER